MSDIKFKIISKHPEQHSVVVRYFTDLLTEDMLATSFHANGMISRNASGSPLQCQTDYNLTVWNVGANTQAILKIANDSAPVGWLKLQEQIRTAPSSETSMAQVDALIGTEHNYVSPIVQTSNNENVVIPELITEDDIETFIQNMSANTP